MYEGKSKTQTHEALGHTSKPTETQTTINHQEHCAHLLDTNAFVRNTCLQESKQL